MKKERNYSIVFTYLKILFLKFIQVYSELSGNIEVEIFEFFRVSFNSLSCNSLKIFRESSLSLIGSSFFLKASINSSVFERITF
ncbi:TPA: hypothetical protein DEG21_02485 [Patescibacteria group bacterium]|nr:hypothetical protein [Candidatus Gracilibacteria bacterium]